MINIRKLAMAGAVGAAFLTAAAPAIAQANFGQVVSSIQTVKKSTDAVKAMTEVKSVTVVKVADLKDMDANALTNAMDKNKADIDELHKALMANAKVAEALGGAAVDVNSVVGVDISSDNVLTVYVQ